MADLPIDAVLLAPSPSCTVDDACIIAQRFGLEPMAATDLGSERDRAFLLVDADGHGLAVMKVSNSAESAGTLDMEAAAVAHIARVDPDLPVARPWPVPDEPGTQRAAWHHDGRTHWVRMYDVIQGRARHDPRTLDDAAIVGWGTTTARLGRSLRGFIHPRAIRTMPWDVQHAGRCRAMVPAIRDAPIRAMVTRVLDRFDAEVGPRWAALRAQVVHGDLTIDNTLLDDAGRIVGIVDFGDMSHTALITDIASVLDSLGTRRDPGDARRVARLMLDGYQRITPLAGEELDLVGDLWATRVGIGLAIASWRIAEGIEGIGFADRYHDSAATMLDHLLSIGWDGLRRSLTEPHDGASADGNDDDHRFARDTGLAARRAEVFGPAVDSLSYDAPIEMARAAGTWMFDADGRRYLDMYNNVPCVGHAHPRVVEAIARQARVLNTNVRYLHGSAIELAERLVATCGAPLDTVLFVNSGSEANDLAWRLATTFTSNTGGLCTSNAYHGISHAIAQLSPETLPAVLIPTHIERWTPTDSYRGLHADASGFVDAIARLARRGVAPAMAILDGVLQSDGVYDLQPEYVQELVRLTRAAGGLWVADEVQGGHGRSGDAMWSYQRFGIQPDIVTLGKPMGNGHPVAAVITRRDIAERFAADTVFFSTFGGNQVSVAAAHAVLDVLDDERVLERVSVAGSALRSAVRAATAGASCVGDVRGIGLANAIEIVRDRATKEPDPATARVIREAMRHHGVLVGTTGPIGNIVKVRPPLSFTEAEVPHFVEALVRSLDGEVQRVEAT